EAPYGHDGKWRWMLFDLDYGMGRRIHPNTNFEGNAVDFNMIQHVMSDEDRMVLFKKLMKNKDVQKQFISIMLDLIDTNFEATNVKNKLDELAEQLRPEIQQSITR